MDIQYFIVEDKIGNANSTRDKVFIPSKNTFKATIDTKTGQVYYTLVVPTDYARLNNAYCAYDMIQFTGGDPTTMYWLRDYENGKVTAMTPYGDIANGPPTGQNLCVCPIIRLDINKILQSQEALNFFKINQSLDKSGKTKYSMFIGEFPQTYVGNRQNEHMEKVLSISSATNKNTSSTLGIINPSGKKYFGHYNTNNNTTINNNTVQKYKTIRKNPYGVRVAKGGISKSEQIKFYVEKGKS